MGCGRIVASRPDVEDREMDPSQSEGVGMSARCGSSGGLKLLRKGHGRMVTSNQARKIENEIHRSLGCVDLSAGHDTSVKQLVQFTNGVQRWTEQDVKEGVHDDALQTNTQRWCAGSGGHHDAW